MTFWCEYILIFLPEMQGFKLLVRYSNFRQIGAGIRQLKLILQFLMQ